MIYTRSRYCSIWYHVAHRMHHELDYVSKNTVFQFGSSMAQYWPVVFQNRQNAGLSECCGGGDFTKFQINPIRHDMLWNIRLSCERTSFLQSLQLQTSVSRRSQSVESIFEPAGAAVQAVISYQMATRRVCSTPETGFVRERSQISISISFEPCTAAVSLWWKRLPWWATIVVCASFAHLSDALFCLFQPTLRETACISSWGYPDSTTTIMFNVQYKRDGWKDGTVVPDDFRSVGNDNP